MESPHPFPKAPPSRRIAMAFNGTIVVLLLSSFVTCNKYGCSSGHLDSDAMAFMAIASGVWCLVAAVVAVVIFVKNLRVETEARQRTMLGLAATLLVGFAGVFLTPLFWLAAGSGSAAIGFGGWGRPLRVRGKAITPGVRASSEWASGPRPRVDDLDRDTRALLRDLWLHDARKEHASVPAFGRVALQLVALGAPSDLVKRAHRSCLQEIDHAERCFALASAYAGEDLGVLPMPALLEGGERLPRGRTRALVKMATEALVDGALLEDYNAELAATALADVRDEAARAALVRIVEDERDHASLAWDIIAFCVERGGPEVAAAVRSTFERIPDAPVSLYADELARRVEALADKSALYAHGRVNVERALDVYRARREAAARRLGAMLVEPRAA